MVLGGQEQIVCNATAKDFFNKSEVAERDLVEYEDADHCIMQDREYWPTVAMDVIGW